MRKLIEHIEGLKISQGQGAGQAFVMLPWERRFLRGMMGVPGDVALSVARGNGKSTLIAGIAHAALDGPLAQPRADVVVCASSFGQGRIVFDHLLAFCGENVRREFRVWDSAQVASIENRKTGAKVRCIGSDPKRAHGPAPALVICDEGAQWPAPTADAMLSALRTGLGKIPGSRLIAIGTRPASATHWFSRLLDGGAQYSQSHAAGKDDPVFHRRTWRKANPSLDFMPTLEDRIRLEAHEARTDPEKLASFKALRLNLGTSDVVTETLLDADDWARVEVDQVDLGGRYVLGLDLGSSHAMSAAAGYWPDTGALEAVAAFPSIPSLQERGIGDGVSSLYVKMHKRQELMIAGQRVVDIAVLMGEVLERWGRPSCIVLDRWREKELREVLDKIKFPMASIVTRGQGFRDGGEDCRAFVKAVKSGQVSPSKSLLLRSALSEVRVMVDPSANRKIAKGFEAGRRFRAKDDAAVAAVLAVAEGVRRVARKPKRGLKFAIA